MKNLLERMKPEPLAKMKEEILKYPNTFEFVEEDLRNNHSILNLKFNTIWNLHHYGIAKSQLLTDITILFNY